MCHSAAAPVPPRSRLIVVVRRGGPIAGEGREGGIAGPSKQGG